MWTRCTWNGGKVTQVTCGRSFKGIIWSQKREKSVSFFCGQRYSWTKVLRIRLLVRAYALIFRNQNPAYTIKKRKGKLSSIGRAALLATAYWLLRVDLDSTWQHAHNRAFDEVFTCARAVCDSASTYLVVCRFNPSTNSLTALRDICGRAAGN